MDLTEERVAQLTKAVRAQQQFEFDRRQGRYDGEDVGLIKQAEEEYQANVAYELINLLGDYSNVLSSQHEKLIADAFARLHPTLLAGILRAVLMACQQHRGDGRIPEWAQTGMPVPLV